MGLFDFFSKPSNSNQKVVKAAAKALNYPPKIVLAWSKIIEGNEEIAKWLNENGYKELVIATAAIKLNTEARDWLMQNGYPHLMAMINAAEGIESAQKWLLKNNYSILYHIAMAVENENESWIWLKQKATPDLFILAQSIKQIKDKIDENHNDIHSFGKDL